MNYNESTGYITSKYFYFSIKQIHHLYYGLILIAAALWLPVTWMPYASFLVGTIILIMLHGLKLAIYQKYYHSTSDTMVFLTAYFISMPLIYGLSFLMAKQGYEYSDFFVTFRGWVMQFVRWGFYVIGGFCVIDDLYQHYKQAITKLYDSYYTIGAAIAFGIEELPIWSKLLSWMSFLKNENK